MENITNWEKIYYYLQRKTLRSPTEIAFKCVFKNPCKKFHSNYQKLKTSSNMNQKEYDPRH